MPIVLAFATAILLVLAPLPASAQDAGMTLDAVSKALGADDLTSILYTGSGAVYAVGQSAAPGLAWPQFNLKSLTRSVNYDTASLRDEQVRTQALKPPRGGDVQPIRGEQWLDSLVSGGFAWNIVLGRPSNAPMTLAERQFRLWSTPHGVIKGAHIYRASVQGRTIAFKVPGRFRLKATVGDDNLISKVEGLIPDPLVGDLAVEIIYSEYRNFDGVMFPMRIREKSGGFPSLDLTVSDVRPNLPVVIQALPVIRQAFDPAGRVVRQKVADGVWYLTGGTYHSVVIEMKDHLIVVEAPLNEEHAMALLAETRKLVPGKPIRYVINTHHHYDHAGGLRTFVAEGITVITHEINKAFLEQALAAPATVRPDRQAKAARKPIVEGVRDRRTLTDGARIVELYHIAGNPHDDGMLMVYLPQEKLLSEADAYSPPLRNATPPMPPSPVTVNLVDNIARLGLDVGNLAPLHGRLVPLAELYLAIGKNP